MTDGYDKIPSDPQLRDTVDVNTNAAFMRKKSLSSLDKAREEILARVEKETNQNG